MKRNRSYTRF